MNIQDDEEKSISSASGEDDGPIYNPKNLPLGWDGKPIRNFLIKFFLLKKFL